MTIIVPVQIIIDPEDNYCPSTNNHRAGDVLPGVPYGILPTVQKVISVVQNSSHSTASDFRSTEFFPQYRK